MISESYDHVCFVNFYTTQNSISNSVVKTAKRILIVSTHAYFKNEQIAIKNNFPNSEVDFLEFDHWNGAISKAEIDLRAYEASKKWINKTSIYQGLYFKNIAFLKNQYIHNELKKEGKITEDTSISVYCQAYELYNLGLSYSYWNSVNAVIVNEGHSTSLLILKKNISSLTIVKLAVYYLNALRYALTPIKCIEVQDGKYLFYLTTLKRIKLKENAETMEKWIWPWTINFKKAYLAAPLHSSGRVLSMAPFLRREKMVIVQDAFRPTTYPPYYYALSYSGCIKIASNKIDFKYLSEAGLKVLPLGTLLAPKQLKEVMDNSVLQVRTICLSLNHSGPWSSLISRCDTDGLIVKFAELAEAKPDLHFVIRVHPNSDDLKAEGVGWIKRVREQVLAMKLSNLKVSTATIEEDWARSDLFISEYSLSVIDALQFGKIVIFINTTNRVSFVGDLTDVGFPEVNSLVELKAAIEDITSDPSAAFRHLALACKEFNKEYNNF